MALWCLAKVADSAAFDPCRHSRGVRVVPSTGRARAGPWTETVLAAHPVLQRGSPGVYINGCSAFTEDGEALASTYLYATQRARTPASQTPQAGLPLTVLSLALDRPQAVAERLLRWWRSAPEAAGCGLVAYVGGEPMHLQPLSLALALTLTRTQTLSLTLPRTLTLTVTTTLTQP